MHWRNDAIGQAGHPSHWTHGLAAVTTQVGELTGQPEIFLMRGSVFNEEVMVVRGSLGGE